MRLVISGGTGLIGRALARAALAAGDEVLILSRAPVPERLPNGARGVRWDPHQPEAWRTALEGADAVVNLAGASVAGGLWTRKRKALIVQSRVRVGESLTQAILQLAHPPRVLVQASGVGYYGRSVEHPVDESAPPGTDFLARLAAEAWEPSTAPVERLGVRRVIIRTGLVLSREGGSFPLMALPTRLGFGGPLGKGRQWLPWIHIHDEVEAIRYLVAHPTASGPFNLVAPGIARQAEFGKALARALRRPYWFPTPAFALRFVLGEMASLVLEGQHVIPRRLLDVGYRFLYPELSEALAAL